MYYTPGKLDSLLDSIPSHIPVTVINQDASTVQPAVACVLLRENVRCFTFGESGLSRSRNRAIQLAEGEFLLVCDDDIVFVPHAFERIQEWLNRYPQDTVLTFQMTDLAGAPRKRYRKHSFPHDRWSIAKVSSCEIGFRRDAILNSGIRYDENFGLGTSRPLGEEVIFLKDCLDHGHGVRFLPLAISRHPFESTGRCMDRRSEQARGAVFFRVYGRLAWLIGPVFYLRKRHELPASLGFLGALNAYFGTCREHRSSNH